MNPLGESLARNVPMFWDGSGDMDDLVNDEAPKLDATGFFDVQHLLPTDLDLWL